ncbi:MAG: TetR/AcrR family transcriptional regulator [Myxococcota bacterium]
MTDSADAPASAGPGEHTDTKERLLEATLRLFAEGGLQGTSMRAVTQAAGTSVSAANYHFGSKEAMLRAALRLRAEPLNQLRIDALEEVVAGAPRPSVEAVVGAFLRPVFEVRAASAGQGELGRNFAARLYMEPEASVSQIRHEVFERVNECFRAALARALPGVGSDTVALGQRLSVAVLVHVVSNTSASGGDDLPQPPVDAFIAFVAAGIRALAEDPDATESAPAAGDAS